MEPRKEEKQEPKAPQPRTEPRRFRLVKLEEHIAPAANGQAGFAPPTYWPECSFKFCK